MSQPWPLFDLRLRTERLQLRLPTEEEVVELLSVAKAGIHPPEVMPFAVAWTDIPSPAFDRQFLQYHWRTRATWSPEAWTLDLGVFLDGRPIGTQGLFATEFPVLRTVNTGSWLGLRDQGRGIGREMRQAVLALAFDHLGARYAESSAFVDNPASAAVSRAIGYDENGRTLKAPRGEARDLVRYRISAEQWRARSRPSVEVVGLGGCLELFGVS